MVLWLLSVNALAQGPEFLSRLRHQADFDLLKGKPLNEKYGQVESIKVILDLRTDLLYFVSSSKFEWHYDFCRERLGYWQSNYLYNQANYADSPDRRFALANINHLVAGDRWSLEFTSADQIVPDMALKLYERVADSSFVGKKLAIFLNTPRLAAAFATHAARHGAAVITPDEVYAGLKYQALNCKVGFGYLRRLPVDSLENNPPGPTDIVVLDGPALDIPAVAGLLSPEFQTPLSHLNMLCKNRGTPFLAQKGIWDDPAVLGLENQLIRIEVFQDSFHLRPCKLADAQAFWAHQRPKSVQKLKMNVKTAQLQSMERLGLHTTHLVGGKASNFAVLSRLSIASEGKFRVPEGAFAIPFHWYWQHLIASGAKAIVDSLLINGGALADSKALKTYLDRICAKIEAFPVNTLLINEINNHVRASGTSLRMRFRSSTNAEDIEGFNGAGLYESKTGILGDTAKSIDDAIRAVWASLWNFRAFQEREYYRIDHRHCAMGLLVHRAFPDESANGVAITKNLYRPDYYGFVINVQKGEVSVVSPPPGVTCDQLICYSDSDLDFYSKKRIVEYISTSSLGDGQPVLTDAQIVLLTEQLAAIKRYYFQLHVVGPMNGPEIAPATNALYNRFALDVEFKFDGPSNQLYIKQVRPFED
jgi:pyruvate, water dikinase